MKNSFLGLILLLTACQGKVEEFKPTKKDVVEYVFASGVLNSEQQYNLTALSDGYLVSLNLEENQQLSAGAQVALIANVQNETATQFAEKLLALERAKSGQHAAQFVELKVKIEQLKTKSSYDSLQVARYNAMYNKGAIAKASVDAVVLQFESTKSDLKALIQNYEQLQSSAEMAIVAKASDAQLSKLTANDNAVRVPCSGTVVRKLKRVGDFVRKGEAIAVIADLNRLVIKAEVEEGSIGKIKPGQVSLVTFNAQSDNVLKAIVSEIAPVYDPASQTYTVKLIFDSIPPIRILDSKVQVNIETGITKGALLIPKELLNYANEVHVKGVEKPVQVKVKYVGSNWVQVLSGVSEESVLLKSNIPIK